MPKHSKMAEFLRSVADAVANKKPFIYAAASDYYLVMSLVPLLMLLVSLIKYLPFDQSSIMYMFEGTVPPSVYSIVDSIVSSIYSSGGGVVTLSIFLTLFAASAAVRALMTGLDDVYDADRRERVPMFFFRAIRYTIVLVVIITLSLVVMVFGAEIIRLLYSVFPGNPIILAISSGARYLRYLLVNLILIIAFMLMYCRLPAGKRGFFRQFPGALFCAASWSIFSWVFSLYISVSDKFGAFGYIGTMLVAMLWIYGCFVFLFIGGCINSCLEKMRTAEAAGVSASEPGEEAGSPQDV